MELGNELETLAARVGHVGAGWAVRQARTYHQFMTTEDLAASEAAAQGDIEFSERADIVWWDWSHLLLGLARFYAGDWGAARSELDAAARLDPGSSLFDGVFPSFVLFARAHAGERDALDPLQAYRSQLLGIRAEMLIGLWEQLQNVVESLALLGQRQDAADLYPLVLKGIQKGIAVNFTLRPWQMTAGIAAASGERWDAAQEHFETALRQAHELPLKIAQPEVRRWYAQMLLDRDASGDRHKARTLLGEAVDMYQRIGMPRHVEMATEILKGTS